MVLGVTSQLGPCLRVIVLILAVTLLCLMYILGDYHTKFLHPVIISSEPEPITSMAPKEGFLIWTPSCQIPDIDPNHHSILKLLKIPEPIVCSSSAPLTFVTGPSNSSYQLVIDEKVASKFLSKNQKLYCCYSVVTRVNVPSDTYNQSADNFYNVTSCADFVKQVDLPQKAEFIYVKCYKKKDGKILGKKDTYKNMHAVVPVKDEIKNKIENHNSAETKHPKLNVLLLGIDSVSRLNIMRTMSRTLFHLRHNDWTELNGYNKIGDNTFPNLMAILTGKTVKEIENICWPTRKSKLDNCPLLWNEFGKRGYVTMYAEDEPTVSTFNYHKTGFVNPPTDYYFRPYMLAAENLLSKVSRDGLNVCTGPVSTTDHLLNYLSSFAKTFKEFNFFSLVWINNFSHNNHNTPAAMDLRFVRFFDELRDSGILNTTMVVFFSDHGMRFGKIRETYVGWLEERLPFIFIWVPEWFQKVYPKYYHNLRVNSNRLTTPFDLHATLKHVLNETYGEQDKRTCDPASCYSSQSLFSESFGDRSCEDVGINPHWCTCSEYQPLPLNDKKVYKVATYVLNMIQWKLRKGVNETTNGKHCANLKLNRIIRARAKVHQVDKHPVGYDDYVVVFETSPGEAMFESTVRQYENGKYELLGFISRINSYASQSKCINDGELKLYCFCR